MSVFGMEPLWLQKIRILVSLMHSPEREDVKWSFFVHKVLEPGDFLLNFEEILDIKLLDDFEALEQDW